MRPRAAPPVRRARRRHKDAARVPAEGAEPPGSNPQVTPIVIDGVMYLPARGNQVLALEADTGQGGVAAHAAVAASGRRRAASRTGPATAGSRRASC